MSYTKAPILLPYRKKMSHLKGVFLGFLSQCAMVLVNMTIYRCVIMSRYTALAKMRDHLDMASFPGLTTYWHVCQ